MLDIIDLPFNTFQESLEALMNNITKLIPTYEKSVIDFYSAERNFVFSVYGRCESPNFTTNYYFNTSFLITINLLNGIQDPEIDLRKLFKISFIKIKIAQ